MKAIDWILAIAVIVLVISTLYDNPSQSIMNGPKIIVKKEQMLNQMSIFMKPESGNDINDDKIVAKMRARIDLEVFKNNTYNREFDNIKKLIDEIVLVTRLKLLEIDKKKKQLDMMYDKWPSYTEPLTPEVIENLEEIAVTKVPLGPVAFPVWRPLGLVPQQEGSGSAKNALSTVRPGNLLRQTASPEKQNASSIATKRESKGVSITKVKRSKSVSPEIEEILSGFQLQAVERGFMVIVPGIDIFVRNSRDLAANAHQILKPIATVAQLYRDFSLEIVGHSDSFKSEAESKTLSRQRAELVKQILAREFEIEIGRMRVDGQGSERPIASNASLDGRRANRRIEISFVK